MRTWHADRYLWAVVLAMIPIHRTSARGSSGVRRAKTAVRRIGQITRWYTSTVPHFVRASSDSIDGDTETKEKQQVVVFLDFQAQGNCNVIEMRPKAYDRTSHGRGHRSPV